MKVNLIKFLGGVKQKRICWIVVSAIAFCFPLVGAGQTWDYSSVEIIDAGYERYRAFVIQHPTDKRKVKGYFHLTAVVSPSMSEGSLRWNGDFRVRELDPNAAALRHLVEAINKYTDIKADFGKRVSMADRELLKVPWVFISSRVFHPTDIELANLGRYLLNGGFLFLDAGIGIGSQKDVNLRDILRKALAKVGKPCEFRRLPKRHRIYHCYYDFDTVPIAFAGRDHGGRGNLVYPEFLIGVDVEGRTAAVLCYADIGNTWQSIRGFSAIESLAPNYIRSLQFGINTVVYALTQKGSITDKIVRSKLGD